MSLRFSCKVPNSNVRKACEVSIHIGLNSLPIHRFRTESRGKLANAPVECDDERTYSVVCRCLVRRAAVPTRLENAILRIKWQNACTKHPVFHALRATTNCSSNDFSAFPIPFVPRLCPHFDLPSYPFSTQRFDRGIRFFLQLLSEPALPPGSFFSRPACTLLSLDTDK